LSSAPTADPTRTQVSALPRPIKNGTSNGVLCPLVTSS
jgi:hypothetical protein